MKNRQLPFDKLATHQNKKAIDFTNNGGVFVIPYSFVTGGENISESGIISGKQLDSASFLEYVFSGREALKVCWDNSTILSPYSQNSNLFQYDFDIGDYFIGKPITGSCSGATEISSVEGNDDFLAMKSSSVITLHFEYDKPISFEEIDYLIQNHKLIAIDEYKRKIYKIPELGGNKYYYITNAAPVFDDVTGRVIGEEIEFSTILDKLQNSGRAIEQYIQNNSPGEPYASPQINLSTDSSGREIKELVLNESTSTWGNDKLIKYIQIEQQGTSATGGVTVFGRRIQYDSENKVWYSKPWTFLVPSNWYQFNNNPLNKTSLPTSTFNFIPDFKLKMSATADWMKVWKEVNDSLSTMSYAGRVVLGQKEDYDGQYFTGDHKSNLNNLAYWDPNWLPFVRDTQREFDMKGCVYTAPKLYFKTTDSFTNIFIKNSFVCLNNLLLPTEFEQKKPYRLSNIPVIGSLVSAFIGDRTVSPNTYTKEQEGLGCFIDKTFARTLLGITSAINEKEVEGHSERSNVESFLNGFGGEMIPKYFGSTCYNTTLCYKLSDIINQTQEGVTADYPTYYFGQTKKEDGTFIFNSKKPCNLQDDFTVKGVNYGFVIDKVIVNSLFSGNIRITCYGEGFVPQYATTIVSNAKWLDNAYNNWTSQISLGTWPDNYVSHLYNPTWPESPTMSDTTYPMNYAIDLSVRGDSTFNCNDITSNLGARDGVENLRIIKEVGFVKEAGVNTYRKDINGRSFTYAYGGAYTGRDDFISRVKTLEIDLKNSSIGRNILENGNVKYTSDNKNNNIKFDLQAGVYAYTVDITYGFGKELPKFNCGSIGYEDFGNDSFKTLKDLYSNRAVRYIKYDNAYLDYDYSQGTDLGYTLSFISATITITLGESLADGLVVNISNIKHIVGNNSAYNPSGTQGDNEIIRQTWITPNKYKRLRYYYGKIDLHLIFNGMNRIDR